MTTNVKVVAPRNMGTRLEFDGTKYNVYVADLELKTATLIQNQAIPLNKTQATADQMVNLDSDLTGIGFKVFYGIMDTHSTYPYITEAGTERKIETPSWVKGMLNLAPNDVKSGGQVAPGYKESDFPRLSYDFTGWQIATPVEVIQFVTHNNRLFTRNNEYGMRLDGSFIDSTKWSKWVRL